MESVHFWSSGPSKSLRTLLPSLQLIKRLFTTVKMKQKKGAAAAEARCPIVRTPPQPHTAAANLHPILALCNSLHCSTSPLLDAASRQPHCTSLLPIRGTRPRRLHRSLSRSRLLLRHTPQSILSLTSKLTGIFFGALVSTLTQSDSPSPRICLFPPSLPSSPGHLPITNSQNGRRNFFQPPPTRASELTRSKRCLHTAAAPILSAPGPPHRHEHKSPQPVQHGPRRSRAAEPSRPSSRGVQHDAHHPQPVQSAP